MKLLFVGRSVATHRSLSLIALCLAACHSQTATEIDSDQQPSRLLEPGVSDRLAEMRAATISNLRYALSLSVPGKAEESITGRAVVRFDLSDPTNGLIFDFAQPADRVLSISLSGTAVDYRVENEHIVIDPDALEAGATEIAIDFVAGDGPLNRSEDFLYTLFVPARARAALPIFDQPDLKARYSLELEIPEGWQAVANGAEDSNEIGEGRRHIRFRETRPISTYLFAFAAGDFQIESTEIGGRQLQMFHRETDRNKVDRNLEAIFQLHAAALDWLESYTGIDYPFEKFAFAAFPAFQFGGMEHPGAIFYRDRHLFLDETATQRQILGRARLIAHEVAHMWFGDLVTMEWFDDVWMKEVFANFMAAKIVNPSFPEIDHDLAFLLDHYPSAYAVDRTAGANPIRQPLENLDDAGSLYGNIIYDKAPIVMKHLELLTGEEKFQAGLREYLESYTYSNATWPDLIEILDRLTGDDLQSWSRVWVTEPGRPTIETLIESDTDLVSTMRIRQKDPAGRGRVWIQPLTVLTATYDSSTSDFEVETTEARLEGAEVLVPGLAARRTPDLVLANGAGIGYGNFRLTRESVDTLLEHLDAIESALIRAVAWVTLWDSMLDGRVAPEDLVGLVIRTLPAESSEQNVQRVLSYSEEAFWKYLSAAERSEIGPILENLLFESILAAPSISLKSVFFQTFRNIVTTAEGIQQLESIWRGDLKIPELSLSEDDLTTLAESLALRDPVSAEAILDLQYEQIENPDRRTRFEFVRPSLSAEVETRDRFFESLREPENRKREPWVLDSLGYLHHPLRADSAERYILPSLNLLEEIRQTGDIFFPLAWLQATLGGHNSQSAAAIVRSFLDERADLSPRLRGKLLQAADPLFRAAEIVDIQAE